MICTTGLKNPYEFLNKSEKDTFFETDEKITQNGIVVGEICIMSFIYNTLWY
jgi:hypothetical protein